MVPQDPLLVPLLLKCLYYVIWLHCTVNMFVFHCKSCQVFSNVVHDWIMLFWDYCFVNVISDFWMMHYVFIGKGHGRGHGIPCCWNILHAWLIHQQMAMTCSWLSLSMKCAAMPGPWSPPWHSRFCIVILIIWSLLEWFLRPCGACW